MQELSLTPAAGSSHFFESENVDLLICGEGPLKALIKTMKALGNKKYNYVINAGVVGSLRADFEKGQMIGVGTTYHASANNLHFQSFPLLRAEGLDIHDNLTVDRRQHFMDDKDPLRAFADVIDRELWGIAQACHEHQTPLLSIKIVSDHVLTAPSSPLEPAGAAVSSALCAKVRAEAKLYSESLFRAHAENVHPFLDNLENQSRQKEKFFVEVGEEYFKNPEYLWTHSLRVQFEALLGLSLRRDSGLEATKSWLRANSHSVLMKKKSSSRKEKTKLLLKVLERTL